MLILSLRSYIRLCVLSIFFIISKKYFMDKFLKYHKDLDDQVREELIKINLETQFRQSITVNRTQMAESLSLQAQ